MALFCKEAGNTKSGECKDVITAYLKKGKYIWFLNELQDSVSKTNGDAGAYAIPVSNQYDEKNTAECDASAPWTGADFKIRSNKGERHYSDVYKRQHHMSSAHRLVILQKIL